MADTNNKYINVAYELYTANDEGVMEMTEKAPEEHPFHFISGLGTTLEAFEKNLLALEKGQEFDFTLSVDEAYGPHVPEGVQTLPKSAFIIGGKFDEERIYEGAVIPMMSQEGQRFNATVTVITENEVTVDLNHPLADKELNFRGKVLEMRDATNQELQDELNQMTSGCGGGCGGCGGGCGDGGCGGGCGDGGCGGGEGGCGCK